MPRSWKNSSVLFSSLLYIISTYYRLNLKYHEIWVSFLFAYDGTCSLSIIILSTISPEIYRPSIDSQYIFAFEYFESLKCKPTRTHVFKTYEYLWCGLPISRNRSQSLENNGRPISHHSSVEHPEFSCVFWEWRLFRFLMKITYARSSRLKNLSNLSIIVSCLETCLRQQHYWVQNQW